MKKSWQVKGLFIFVTEAETKKEAIHSAIEAFDTAKPRLIESSDLNWTAFSRKPVQKKEA